MNIPLHELRARLGELDKSKPVYVNCFSGMRSYIACRIEPGRINALSPLGEGRLLCSTERGYVPVSYTHLDVYKRQKEMGWNWQHKVKTTNSKTASSAQPKPCLLYTSRCV